MFCIPALEASAQITQAGCGIGQIDSDGGSDYTVSELGDTSFTSASCNVQQFTCPSAGPAPDSSLLLRVKVGNGVPDTCTSGGMANLIASIPAFTTTWVATDSSCPDTDGTYNPATDTLLSQFSQTLDFTTDTASASFQDLDGDGCFKSGIGPAAGFSTTGVCLDPIADTVTLAAGGTIGSSGGPLYDLAFSARLASAVTGPAPSGGATCAAPPSINFSGRVDRCIIAPQVRQRNSHDLIGGTPASRVTALLVSRRRRG